MREGTRRIHWWLVMIALWAAAGLTYADVVPCSKEVEVSGNCSDPRACDIQSHANCLTEVDITPRPRCTSEGAVAADNCVTTTTLEGCGTRRDCQMNTEGTACISGELLGLVVHHKVKDGGGCLVE